MAQMDVLSRSTIPSVATPCDTGGDIAGGHVAGGRIAGGRVAGGPIAAPEGTRTAKLDTRSGVTMRVFAQDTTARLRNSGMKMG